MNHDHDELSLAVIKVGVLWIIGIIAHNYHLIAGNILVTISIGYIVWKWRRDFKKAKEENKI